MNALTTELHLAPEMVRKPTVNMSEVTLFELPQANGVTTGLMFRQSEINSNQQTTQ